MTRTFRFEDWKAANVERTFGWVDYAHSVLKEHQVPGDFAIAMAQLLWPEFIEVEGSVFLAEQYSSGKALRLEGQGFKGAELEYWMNLFSVDGFLDGVDSATEEDEEQLATLLVKTWQAKLRADFPLRSFRVLAVRDDEAGDLCVTLTSNT
jgi:hypothetical protein